MRCMILFLCPHGGAKSVIAAAYLSQLLPGQAMAAAAEDPYDSVPAPVAAMLASEGVDVSEFRPRSVEPRDLERATRIIAIGCDVPGANVERWNDVPMASVDLEGSAAAIRRHVEQLAAELRGR